MNEHQTDPRHERELTEKDLQSIKFARQYSTRKFPKYSDKRKAYFVQLIAKLADQLELPE